MWWAILASALAFTPSATLEFNDEAVVMQRSVLAADHSTSSVTPAAVANWSVTPDESGTYFVRVFVGHTAAVGTTGLAIGIDCGDGSGAVFAAARGVSATAGAAYYGPYASGTSLVAGASSSGLTPAWSFAFCVADATPTPIQVFVASEVGASEVTVKAGSLLEYFRVL